MKSPIRILHVFSTFVPGGPQVRVTRVLNRLGPALSNTVLAMDGRTAAASRLDPSLDVKMLPPPPRKNSLFAPVYLRRTIRGQRPDLVVTYNWGAMDAVAGAQLAHVCPVIHTEDGFGSDEASGLKTRRVLARRFLLNRVFRTVVPSEQLLHMAKTRYHIRPEKVQLIPNGVDTMRFHPGREHGLRERIGIREGEVLCGYVGHLRPEKSLSVLIRAFAQAHFNKLRLVLVGDGPCRRHLEQLAGDLGVQAAITFAGAVDDPAPWYRALDLFAMSSVTEQMPMSLLEAMASGLPAVSTNVGDIRRMLAAGSAEVVPPGECEQLARSLRLLAGSPSLRSELGAKNRSRCVEHYSEETMIEAYARLYEAASMPD